MLRAGNHIKVVTALSLNKWLERVERLMEMHEENLDLKVKQEGNRISAVTDVMAIA